MWPAPVLRLQHLAVRGAARLGGPCHGRCHPRHLLHEAGPQEASQCYHQQPKVIEWDFCKIPTAQINAQNVNDIFLFKAFCI